MSDRFQDLRTFVAVVQSQGFNVAADRLGLVKSAVSRRIGEMEQRLGTRLLNRTTRQISVTEAGAELYWRSLKILADLQEAEDMASTVTEEASGRLRVTAPVSFTTKRLAPVLGEFLIRNPKLVLDLRAEDRVADLVSEGFDLAIRLGKLKDSALIARKIAAIDYVFVASPSYLDAFGRPRTPVELAGHRKLSHDATFVGHWSFRNGDHVEIPSIATLDNEDAMFGMTKAGSGIALLPTFLIRDAVSDGSLEIILPEFVQVPMEMHAVFPSSRNLPTKVRAFMTFLMSHFGPAEAPPSPDPKASATDRPRSAVAMEICDEHLL